MPNISESTPVTARSTTCSDCGATNLTTMQTNSLTHGIVCENCIDNYSMCECCEELRHNDAIRSRQFEDSNNRGIYHEICNDCLESSRWHCCDNCDVLLDREETDNEYCGSCAENYTPVRNDNEIRYRPFGRIDALKESESGLVLTSLRTAGIELEVLAPSGRVAVAISKELAPHIGLTGDSSISGSGYGLEIQTPPAVGLKAEELITNACKILKSKEVKTNKTCGYHLHLGLEDIDRLEANRQLHAMKLLWLFYIAYEDVILSFLPKSRRGNRYCNILKSDYHFREIAEANNMDELETIWYRVKNRAQLNDAKSENKHHTRYRGINFHTAFSERHLEIRYHSGTINARKILEWANLHAKIVDTCLILNADLDSLLQACNLTEQSEKTLRFFQFIRLSKPAEDYFRTRQNLFAVKAEYKMDKKNKNESEELLKGEAEE